MRAKAKEIALEYHKRGYNCSQSVLAALSKYYKLSEDKVLAIAAGFGGGLRSGEVCGAISGSVMAAGLAFPSVDPADKAAKRDIATISNKCVAAAKCQFGCVRCLELKKNGVSCEEMIGFMAESAEKLIIENKKIRRKQRWKSMKNSLHAD